MNRSPASKRGCVRVDDTKAGDGTQEDDTGVGIDGFDGFDDIKRHSQRDEEFGRVLETVSGDQRRLGE